MLFENVMAILHKCRDAGVSDVMIAENMLVAENIDNADDIREAGGFLVKHYDAITKCNRLNMIDKIEELCENANDRDKLLKLIEEVAEIKE